MIAVLLAIVYLPAMAHCTLEQAGWFPLGDGCCEQSSASGGSENTSCADGCCLLEGGDFFNNTKGVATVLPLAVSAYLVVALDTLAKPAPSLPPESSPPEFLNVWQFAYRTALPPRAPSFVS